jgi:hypothetical protein
MNTFGKLHVTGNGVLRVIDRSLQVSASDAESDRNIALKPFSNERCTLRDPDVSDLSERNVPRVTW